ncbi:hypothetical protein GIB67_020240 [Kingdonia uniflora]|uniref:Transcription factor Iwr1 domain-containing protein n=1 Tax=Kingdonia uniflora TaxID=39325 RepID=A0A7J7P4G2_9MAGN|nr:hypothetical protein GIB67_020240 [Kingdonia uniflora]
MAETSSVNAKPVIVRVKRKSFQSPLEALWLEINERPLKRPLLDFAKLSITSSSGKEEALKTKKVLVQHVETVSCSKDSIASILQNYSDPNYTGGSKFRSKIEERSHTFKQENVLAKNARFEQIWKKRNQKKESTQDDEIRDVCHLYDVVRVDVEEEKPKRVEEPEDLSPEDSALLKSYLPLLEEFLPEAAAQIQTDMQSYYLNQGSADEYVYDLYTVPNELSTANKDVLDTYPLIQVDHIEEDFYDGPDHSDYETDDSNAENNPLNDYPDEEETSEDESEDKEEEEEEEDDDESRGSSDEMIDVKSVSSVNEFDYNGRRYYNHTEDEVDSLYGDDREDQSLDDSNDDEDYR